MKITIKSLNKANLGTWVMTDGTTYIAPQHLSGIELTYKKEAAEKWGYADTLSSKLDYFKKVTGLNLSFVQI